MRNGLVHEHYDAAGGDAALAALLDELLLAGPNAVATAKGLLRRLAQTPVSKELLAELQREFDARRHSPEALEGVASFREKRKPRWAATEQEQ
jgi:methylglutaconyl-CoA hydratase